MAMQLKRLTATAIKNRNKPGLLADGNGLSLQVSACGSKSCAFRFTLNGKPRQTGLGVKR